MRLRLHVVPRLLILRCLRCVPTFILRSGCLVTFGYRFTLRLHTIAVATHTVTVGWLLRLLPRLHFRLHVTFITTGCRCPLPVVPVVTFTHYVYYTAVGYFDVRLRVALRYIALPVAGSYGYTRLRCVRHATTRRFTVYVRLLPRLRLVGYTFTLLLRPVCY